MNPKTLAPALLSVSFVVLLLVAVFHGRSAPQLHQGPTSDPCPELGPCSVKRTCGSAALCDHVEVPIGPLIPLRVKLPESNPSVRAIRSRTHFTGAIHQMVSYWPKGQSDYPNLREVPLEADAGEPYNGYDIEFGHFGMFFVESPTPHAGYVVEWSNGSNKTTEFVSRLPQAVDFHHEVIKSYSYFGSDRAVVNRVDGYGPTYSRTADGGYARHEPNSVYIWNRLAETIHTTCGGGPLTRVPGAWEKNPPPECKMAGEDTSIPVPTTAAPITLPPVAAPPEASNGGRE